MINSAQWKGQIATICLDRWQRIFRVNKTLSIITVKRRASPCANYSSALARRCASHENGNTYVLCSQPGHLRQIGMSQPSACSRLIVPLGKRVHRWNTITLFFFFFTACEGAVCHHWLKFLPHLCAVEVMRLPRGWIMQEHQQISGAILWPPSTALLLMQEFPVRSNCLPLPPFGKKREKRKRKADDSRKQHKQTWGGAQK